ncbi:uncharacterized protein BO96DRAFT_429349 [Aspergillus niger CBS 101883]|uniref:Uncharacterized protein n=2 Tax=Aspergillus niger TaxID=5061 RepID=A2QCJ8_ASPNC|nr:uncharacterized protein BO96DRAFT_429349 [Aspergillus niger CBS 101883]XP_059606829.1 hypothetical protein An02g03820 [Aspergillus niger]PYH62845.1 hypothetical protein BO96DRAFT_429349 [Aspergillus niger CBS 101883]CAL00596.1 hypothetical protein An02g03820 [Aspergillus niger]
MGVKSGPADKFCLGGGTGDRGSVQPPQCHIGTKVKGQRYLRANLIPLFPHLSHHPKSGDGGVIAGRPFFGINSLTGKVPAIDANPKELEDGVCVCVWCRYSGVCGGDGRIPSQILGGEEHVPCHLLPWYLQRAAPTCVSSCRDAFLSDPAVPGKLSRLQTNEPFKVTIRYPLIAKGPSAESSLSELAAKPRYRPGGGFIRRVPPPWSGFEITASHHPRFLRVTTMWAGGAHGAGITFRAQTESYCCGPGDIAEFNFRAYRSPRSLPHSYGLTFTPFFIWRPHVVSHDEDVGVAFEGNQFFSGRLNRNENTFGTTGLTAGTFLAGHSHVALPSRGGMPSRDDTVQSSSCFGGSTVCYPGTSPAEFRLVLRLAAPLEGSVVVGGANDSSDPSSGYRQQPHLGTQSERNGLPYQVLRFALYMITAPVTSSHFGALIRREFVSPCWLSTSLSTQPMLNDGRSAGLDWAGFLSCAPAAPPFYSRGRKRNWIDLPPPLDRITLSVEINTP